MLGRMQSFSMLREAVHKVITAVAFGSELRVKGLSVTA
jgi:hypothetical protein